MKTKILLTSVAMLMMLTACTQEEITPAVERVPVTLAYTTVDATETRAAQNLNEGTFASGESVKVRISNTDANAWTDYTFTTGDAGAMNPASTAPYYPAGTQNIDIVAYYPATAGTSFTVAADQTDNADYKASDLMFASVTNQAKQAEAVNLAFSHKMAKLCVNITAGAGVTSITSVSIINVKPTVTFNQATGAVGEATGTAISIAVSNNGAALIPAQTIDGGLLEIVTDKGTATYSVSNKAFAAGQLYTLNITVNLRAVGTTTAITGWTSEGTVTVNPVMKQKTPAGLVAVDMGNGLKWANMNVGAETEIDFGDYFGWGETMTYYEDGYAQESPCTHWKGGKSGYNWASYTLCNGTQESLNKYNTDANYGYVDDKTVLEPFNDAACANWGGTWRMATEEEWQWLIDNCTWTKQDDYNSTGVKGMLVTSNINGNQIFLPAAGIRANDKLSEVGSGSYWSSSLSLSFNGIYVSIIQRYYDVRSVGGHRCYGLNIRPVTE